MCRNVPGIEYIGSMYLEALRLDLPVIHFAGIPAAIRLRIATVMWFERCYMLNVSHSGFHTNNT